MKEAEIMGRPKTELDPLTLFHLSSMGVTQKDQAEELGVSIPTLARENCSDSRGTRNPDAISDSPVVGINRTAE